MQTDATVTTSPALWVKNTGTTSATWSTFAFGNASGAAVTTASVPSITIPPVISVLESMIVTNILNLTTGTGFSVGPTHTNAGQNNGTMAWYKTQPFKGSIAGLSIGLNNNVGTIPTGTGLTGGNLQALVYSGSSLIAAYTLVGGAGHNNGYIAFSPGSIPFAAGDNLQLWYSAQGATATPAASYTRDANMTYWVYYGS